jgi:type IV pilus assembly protein PilM
MAQITVGLDIGTASIKGVRVARGLRGSALLDHFVHPVPYDPTRGLVQRQEEALRALAAQRRLKGERWVVAMPTASASLRELELPFSDRRKIDQVAPYELEGQIPFDLADVVVAAKLLERSEAGKSRVLAAAVPKTLLQERISLLNQVDIDPQEIDLEGLAVARLYQPWTRGTPGPLLVIEIGAQNSLLCCIEEGRVLFMRGVAIGGEELTRAVAERLSVPLEEAEKIKQEVDLGNPGDQRAEILKEGLVSWVAEVEKSLRLANRPPSRFVLLGGGACLRGFSEYLQERFSLPDAEKGNGASLALDLKGVEEMLVTHDGRLCRTALGLALRPDGPDGINFRKGEFSFGKGAAERRAQWVSIGLTLLVVAGLLLGNVYLRYQIKASRYQSLKADLRERFTKAFPQVHTVTQEVDQAKSAIDGLKRTESFLGIGELPPLLILREITMAVPKETPIEVHDLVIDGGKVRMEAQTDSFESIDRIKGGLVKVQSFRDVTISDAKAAAEPGKVSFRIQFQAGEG